MCANTGVFALCDVCTYICCPCMLLSCLCVTAHDCADQVMCVECVTRCLVALQKCALCQEPLEQCWDEEEETWFYKEAKRGPDQQVSVVMLVDS